METLSRGWNYHPLGLVKYFNKILKALFDFYYESIDPSPIFSHLIGDGTIDNRRQCEISGIG
jgi:hypothetical protein